MLQRPLGNTGLSVPAIMLGANVFGWTLNEADSFRILDATFDAGLTFIDTADVYTAWVPGNSGGESETILGKWFSRSGTRAKVTLATKVGQEVHGGKGLGRKHIEEAVENSLRRLQTDYIDLYQSHIDDAETPLEETLTAFDNLIRQGKVRFIGASNYSGSRLREAMEISKRAGIAAYQTLQPHYNLLEREYEKDLAPVVAEYGLGVIPYYGLGAGFLTGKYRSKADVEGHARHLRLGIYATDRNFAIVAVLNSVAQECGSNAARVALAWLLSRPQITAPIASVTKPEHITDLVEATRLQLSPEAIARLTAAGAQ